MTRDPQNSVIEEMVSNEMIYVNKIYKIKKILNLLLKYNVAKQIY